MKRETSIAAVLLSLSSRLPFLAYRPYRLLELHATEVLKLRSEMVSLAAERRQDAEQLRSLGDELEKLRRELSGITADNAQLRSGLQSVIAGLDEIQRQF